MGLLDDAEFRIATRLIFADKALRDTTFNCPKGCHQVSWVLHNGEPICEECGEEVYEYVSRTQLEYLKKFPLPVSDPKWEKDEINLTFKEIREISKILDGHEEKVSKKNCKSSKPKLDVRTKEDGSLFSNGKEVQEVVKWIKRNSSPEEDLLLCPGCKSRRIKFIPDNSIYLCFNCDDNFTKEDLKEFLTTLASQELKDRDALMEEIKFLREKLSEKTNGK